MHVGVGSSGAEVSCLGGDRGHTPPDGLYLNCELDASPNATLHAHI